VVRELFDEVGVHGDKSGTWGRPAEAGKLDYMVRDGLGWLMFV